MRMLGLSTPDTSCISLVAAIGSRLADTMARRPSMRGPPSATHRMTGRQGGSA